MIENLTKIIWKQRQEMQELLTHELLPRRLEETLDLNSGLAQVVLGMRRAGKSVICRNALRKGGVNFGYVNFDSEEFENLQVSELDGILEAVHEVYGKVRHLFFDEIQNVEGWHLFVNRLLREGYRVVLTGSNARLLTDELATHLTGRYLPYEVTPFSFAEYRAWRGMQRGDADSRGFLLRGDWQSYLFNGGLPEAIGLQDPRGYVSTLYNAILFKDICQRHRVSNPAVFARVAYVLMQQYAREVSCPALAARTGIKSPNTIRKYLFYLKQSYLVHTVDRYSPKPAERLVNEKLYICDPGFISYFTGILRSDQDLGWRLENIVYLELRRRAMANDWEICYYKDASFDIDFALVRYGKIVRLIQVAYAIDSEKARKREIDQLIKAGSKLGCQDLVLVTDHEEDFIAREGWRLRMVPAVRFLLEGEKEALL